MGAKRLGYGGETTRVENRGETTRGETTRGETSWGRNVLLPLLHIIFMQLIAYDQVMARSQPS